MTSPPLVELRSELLALLKDIERRDLKQKWFASSALLSYENASFRDIAARHSVEAFSLCRRGDRGQANAVRSRRKSQPRRQLTPSSKECGSAGPREITANKTSRAPPLTFHITNVERWCLTLAGVRCLK